MLNCKSAFYGP